MEDTRGRVLIEDRRFDLVIERLARNLVENHGNFEETCLVGIQPRGVIFAKRIFAKLKEIGLEGNLLFGVLDTTFYRDDFRQNKSLHKPMDTIMDFIVEDKKVIFADDVLYTGRTVLSAMQALQPYGRPSFVELMTLVDRRFNRQLPVRSNYTGITVDSLDEAYVRVEWKETHSHDRIILFPKK